DFASMKPAAIRAFFANDLRTRRQRRIVDEETAALTRDDILRLVKTESSEIAKSAQRAPLVARHDSLGGVLDDPKPMASRDRQNGIHLAGYPGIVHRNDRARARRDRGLNQPFIQIERILPDIDKHRNCATQGEGVGGRHKCVGRQDDLAAALDIESGGEVILPSYTFVSTANAFALRGAVPVFVDIREDTLNLDERLIEAAITSRTRAIVPVHYAGISCEMDSILAIARRHGLRVVEDAAQGIMASYKGRPLGALGD